MQSVDYMRSRKVLNSFCRIQRNELALYFMEIAILILGVMIPIVRNNDYCKASEPQILKWVPSGILKLPAN